MTDKKPAPPPFSLRLTFQERAELEAAAGDMPLGSFIRSRMLKDGRCKHRHTRGKRPIKDHKALAKIFAELGRMRFSSNLNQLTKAMHIGTLVVTPEVENDIRQMSHDFRLMLMKALGYRRRAHQGDPRENRGTALDGKNACQSHRPVCRRCTS